MQRHCFHKECFAETCRKLFEVRQDWFLHVGARSPGFERRVWKWMGLRTLGPCRLVSTIPIPQNTRFICLGTIEPVGVAYVLDSCFERNWHFWEWWKLALFTLEANHYLEIRQPQENIFKIVMSCSRII